LFGEAVEVQGGAEIPLDTDLDLHTPLLDDPLPDVGAFDTYLDTSAAQDVRAADPGSLQQ
jgi:hypothetical protein